jgi:hypothetical protein
MSMNRLSYGAVPSTKTGAHYTRIALLLALLATAPDFHRSRDIALPEVTCLGGLSIEPAEA